MSSSLLERLSKRVTSIQMGTNSLETTRDRRSALTAAYEALDSGGTKQPPRKIGYEDSRVTALIGRQHTDYLWFALSHEHISEDLREQNPDMAAESDDPVFRILRLDPSYKHQVDVSARPGQSAVDSSLASIQYTVVDAAVPEMSTTPPLGHALKYVQKAYNQNRTQIHANGNVSGKGNLLSLYERQFER